MTWNVKQNPNGSALVFAEGGGSDVASVVVQWATGIDVHLVRGTTNPSRTAIMLRSPNGTAVYITANNDGTMSASTTVP